MTTPADATSAPADGTVVHADVVVVGAGPGGSATAAWLAKDLIAAYLGATFSTSEEFRRRVAKLAIMDAER